MAIAKTDIVKTLLGGRSFSPVMEKATSFAPSNIALVKYWGKRDQAINLPLTSSLSIALNNKGTTTSISLYEQDEVYLNGHLIHPEKEFAKRLIKFLDLFRPQGHCYKVDTLSNIPVAAGLASSASGFAAIVKAFNQFYGWNLTDTELSILSRMGSGSACRSIWQGFVEWQKGNREDGMDSHGLPLETKWPELCIGLLIFNDTHKSIGSSKAMLRTVETSTLFESWPTQVKKDLTDIKTAISQKDFELLGKTAEHNALSMHATMLSSWPPILYSNHDTYTAMQTVWHLRQAGIPVYFTQDAGPNLKLIFEKAQLAKILTEFPAIEIIDVFA